RERDGRVRTSSEAGRITDALAERAAEVVLLAYDPPDPAVLLEDGTPYAIESKNVRFASLGAKGTWRDARARRRRIRPVVASETAGADALLMRLPNRRAQEAWKANRAPVTVA